jgi:hypothetical protein
VLVVVLVLENPDRFAIRLTEQISSIGLFAVKPNARGRGRGRGRRRGRGTIPTSEFRLKKRSTSEQNRSAVDSFNYLSVLLSIVLGLAIAQVLQGLSEVFFHKLNGMYSGVHWLSTTSRRSASGSHAGARPSSCAFRATA